MKKKLFYCTAFLAMLLFGSCINEELLPESENETGRTITLTATMPDDDPTTRVTLTQDGKNIKLNWELGDKIQLLFVQDGAISGTAYSTVYDINGKTAYFTIQMPVNGTVDSSKPFNLYGVYGGREEVINTTENTIHLPQSTLDRNTLTKIKNAKDVILYFVYENAILANQANISVKFNHLGSLFCINLKNSSTTSLTGFDGARLVGVDNSNEQWGYSVGPNGGQYFNLVSGLFQNQESAENFISFNPGTTLSSGQTIEIWAWYPPLPNKVWPELKLKLTKWSGSSDVYTTDDTKPAKTPLAGKTYHFYAEWNGSTLKFVDSSDITDSRDGNVYQTVTIGNQVWMAENLKYLPSVVGPLTGSETNPYYYVYDYDGTDVNEAKATANYSTYGVLYNWPAAMAGVCPTGWHLPSDAEWTQMENYLIANGYNYDGTITSNQYAKALAATTNWNFSTNEGAVGNIDYPTYRNKTGFTALPGGYRYDNGTFYDVGYLGHWWSATESSTNNAWYRYMNFDNSNVSSYYHSKELGFPVRCVRD